MYDELGCYVWQYTRKYNSDLNVYSCFNSRGSFKTTGYFEILLHKSALLTPK